MNRSDEASQAAEGGREEGGAVSKSVAPLYTLLCRPPALLTPLAVTDDFLFFFLWDCLIYVVHEHDHATRLRNYMGK